MDEQKFIAISESEYNSFKHGEYERKIKELEAKIEKLEREKIQIAKAKAVRLESTTYYTDKSTTAKIGLYSDTSFENEILNDMKNIVFSHYEYMSCVLGFDKYRDFVKIGNNLYFKNEKCEELKREISHLEIEIKNLEAKRYELNKEIKKLNKTVKSIKNGFWKSIIELFKK